jgi:signal transduction histidine kinase
MNDLLHDVLLMNQAGRVIRPPERTPVGELVAESLERLGDAIEAGSVEVAVAAALPSLRVDRRRFQEVLFNLVDNAVQFMGDHPSPRIRIGVERGPEGQTLITVADNGIGIEPAYHEKIFGLFERLDADSPGTGVGLALVRRIVEAHGGSVRVESRGRGTGSCFTVELPASDAPESADPESDDSE